MLPSLKEKKRYLAFEVISEKPVGYSDVHSAFRRAMSDYLGQKGCAAAGAIMLKERFNSSKGIIRVNHNYLNDLKASLCMARTVGNQKAMFKSLGASGILKKAYAYVNDKPMKRRTKVR